MIVVRAGAYLTRAWKDARAKYASLASVSTPVSQAAATTASRSRPLLSLKCCLLTNVTKPWSFFMSMVARPPFSRVSGSTISLAG